MKNLFTLIELIVVIVVISILAAIVIPNISDIRERATISALNADARNIETAVDMYVSKNNGDYPTEDKTEVLSEEKSSPNKKTVLVINPDDEKEVRAEEVLVGDLFKESFLKKAPKHKNVKFYLVEGGDVIWVHEKLGIGGEKEDTPKIPNKEPEETLEEDNEGPNVKLNVTDLSTNPTINIVASDPSGIEYILLPDGNKVYSDTATYEVPKDGTYSVTVVDKKGNSTTVEAEVVSQLENKNVANYYYSYGDEFIITTEGELYAKGVNTFGLLGLGHSNFTSNWTKVDTPEKIKSVYQENPAAYFVSETNSLYGTGAERMLGKPNSNERITTLTRLGGSLKVKEIKQGFVLFENGDAYFIGVDGSGESGADCTSCTVYFAKVASNIKEIIGSGQNGISILLGNDNKYYGSGLNMYGFLPEGVGSNWSIPTFTEIGDYSKFRLSEIKKVDGFKNMYFLLENGDFYSSFNNSNYNYLGLDPSIESVNELTKVTSNIKDFYVNDSNVILIHQNGDVYVFGRNSKGELGLEHKNQVFIPTKSVLLSDLKVKEVVENVLGFTVVKTVKNEFYGIGQSSSLGVDTLTPIKLDVKIIK